MAALQRLLTVKQKRFEQSEGIWQTSQVSEFFDKNEYVKPRDLVLGDAGESGGDLCTIFRVATLLERWCLDDLLTPPHR